MTNGSAQDVLNDALRRVENINAALTQAQNAQIACQKAVTEAAKAIDAVMRAQPDTTFLQVLMQQFAGLIGDLDATASGGATEEIALPALNREPDPRVRQPVSLTALGNTASALLGQEPEPPTPFAAPERRAAPAAPVAPVTPAAAPRRRLAASPALEQLGAAAGNMAKELIARKQDIERSAARQGPTVEEDPAVASRLHPPAEEDVSQYVGHFAGPQSLFVRFLSPEITTGGRGFAAPNYAGLKQYKQDITQLSINVLLEENFVTGFYRNGKTGTRQFFMRLPGALVLLDNPMMPNNFPLFAINDRASGTVVWRQVRTLTVSELRTIHDEIIDEFRRLETIEAQAAQQQA
jgi:hypothetical protein